MKINQHELQIELTIKGSTDCIKKKRNPNIMFKAYSNFSMTVNTVTRELIP